MDYIIEYLSINRLLHLEANHSFFVAVVVFFGIFLLLTPILCFKLIIILLFNLWHIFILFKVLPE